MWLLFSIVVAVVAPIVAAQERPDQAEIDEVNRLGGMLYAYDQAAWHGSDAVMPLLRAAGDRVQEQVRGYIAEPVGGTWRVAFGRLSADSSTFLVAYDAHLDSNYAVLNAEAYSTPVPSLGFPREAMRALAAAGARFSPPEQVTYNTAVLPAPGGLVYVYYLPAQPAFDVYYVGADFRYTFDPVAGAITEERRLHNALNSFDLREHPEASTFSSAVLTSIPTETDVFYAMSRPAVPPGTAAHYVLTEDWVFFLGSSGVSGMLTTNAWRTAGSHTEAGRNE